MPTSAAVSRYVLEVVVVCLPPVRISIGHVAVARPMAGRAVDELADQV